MSALLVSRLDVLSSTAASSPSPPPLHAASPRPPRPLPFPFPPPQRLSQRLPFSSSPSRGRSRRVVSPPRRRRHGRQHGWRWPPRSAIGMCDQDQRGRQAISTPVSITISTFVVFHRLLIHEEPELRAPRDDFYGV